MLMSVQQPPPSYRTLHKPNVAYTAWFKSHLWNSSKSNFVVVVVGLSAGSSPLRPSAMELCVVTWKGRTASSGRATCPWFWILASFFPSCKSAPGGTELQALRHRSDPGRPDAAPGAEGCDTLERWSCADLPSRLCVRCQGLGTLCDSLHTLSPLKLPHFRTRCCSWSIFLSAQPHDKRLTQTSTWE